MKRLAVCLAIFFALESAALACSCLGTDDPAELSRLGREAAEGAVALVEAEALTSFEATGTGERMRVVRTLAGSAPATFTVKRRRHPSSASCDVLYRVGERVIVILYPPVTREEPGTFRTSGLCTVHMLDRPAFRDSLIGAMSSPVSRGDRG